MKATHPANSARTMAEKVLPGFPVRSRTEQASSWKSHQTSSQHPSVQDRGHVYPRQSEGTRGWCCEKRLPRGSSKSKVAHLQPRRTQQVPAGGLPAAGCYELSAELNGTNLACLVGDAGVCPSASSLSLKNISCSRFFWFSSSSRALSRREHTQQEIERLYCNYGHCPPSQLSRTPCSRRGGTTFFRGLSLSRHSFMCWLWFSSKDLSFWVSCSIKR